MDSYEVGRLCHFMNSIHVVVATMVKCIPEIRTSPKQITKIMAGNQAYVCTPIPKNSRHKLRDQ